MITVYTFENIEGVEDTFSTMNASDAHSYARAYSRKLIANTYTLDDSELVIDYSDWGARPIDYGQRG